MLAADDEEPETHRHSFSQEEHTHTHSAKTGTHASERGKKSARVDIRLLLCT